MSGVVVAGLAPHPPIIVPEVGRGSLKEVARTCEAMRRWARAIGGAAPQSLVLISPHGPALRSAVPVVVGERFSGSLAAFGAPEAAVDFPGDPGLAGAILEEAGARGLPVVEMSGAEASRHLGVRGLDHGSVVPLYYLAEAGVRPALVPVGLGLLSLERLFALGQAVAHAAAAGGRRVAVVASGDLSHRLKPGAPAGYAPEGRVFDERLVEALRRGDVPAVLGMDPDLAERAGECGLRPLAVALGAVAQAARFEVLSYEGPFGVGYAVALFHLGGRPGRPEAAGGEGEAAAPGPAGPEGPAGPAGRARQGESFPVRLARASLEAYVREGRRIEAPAEVPPEFRRPAGAFVSLHLGGRLRGCIGTVAATQPDVAREIIQNAISAGAHDPRFPPVREPELSQLEYSVDVLGELEPVSDRGQLDPRRYGVVVRKGRRTGLLLPDLAGVDTVEEQVRIACHKAGIDPGEPGVELFRFRVARYH
ncbi:MAG: AmmeMemoRadiSam system protein A [Acetobacteraceae bacterium]|nr:AmmeMemoRadiSam system protein A [Acetobacteraceae bacterium]